jgi:D-aminoacyl-tRNA deacylase
MRVVIQRVRSASVEINGTIQGSIRSGLMILLGIEPEDTKDDIDWLANKIVNLRIFNDEQGVMNRSLLEEELDILLVSQFTLHASTKKGNRPSYIRAARPEHAIPLYEEMIQTLEKVVGRPIQTGQFGADMQVSLVNDGPVTILMDSKNRE